MRPLRLRRRGGSGRGWGPSNRGRRRRTAAAREGIRSSGSSVSLSKDLEGRAEHQEQVEAERPVPRIRDVEVERLAERRMGARRDLPEAGDAGRDAEALVVMRLE